MTEPKERQPKSGCFNWERAAACVICIGAALLALRLFFRYLLGILLPFGLAYLLSLLLRPIVDSLAREKETGAKPYRLATKRRLLSVVLILACTGLVSWLTVSFVRRGAYELENLLVRMSDSLVAGEGAADETGAVHGFSVMLDYIWSLSEHLPFLQRFESTPGFSRFCLWLDEAVRTTAERLVSRLSSFLSSGTVALLSSLPTVLLTLTVFLFSCYYFTAEPDAVSQRLYARLPGRWQAWLSRWWAGAGRSCRQYVRAALLLALITFAEMFAGLMILRKPYAFLLALLIAFVDFLPVLGTGTVLVPWGVAELLLGNTSSGLGLLILYGVSAVLREIIEPHLVGRSLGIHPLVSLFSVYAGYRLFGIPGMVVAPLAVALIKGAGCGYTREFTR